MSQNRRRIREIMLIKAVPSPTGPELISLNVDIDIDGISWAAEEITKAGFSGCCVETFNEVQRLCEFDGGGVAECEIAILLTTDTKLQSLNLQFRGMDRPTNVLSFAALNVDCPPLTEGLPLFLGDIAIAVETVKREAREQNKTVSNHLSHMIIHGTLHLLGYDHEDEKDAQKMEALERKILGTQNIADPYVVKGQML
jgi:probable rRNA maturation factor